MDHETSGAQEWNLPGYGRVEFKEPTGRPRFITPGTREPFNSSAAKNLQTQQSKDGISIGIPSGKQLSENRQRGPFRPFRGRGGFRGKSSPGVPLSSRQSRVLFQDSPAKAKWRSGREPTYIMKLPAAFGSFKHEFFGLARTHILGGGHAAAQARQEVFDAISKKTGAFVKPPFYNDAAICMWGEEAQIVAAREVIESILLKCNSLQRGHNGKKPEWPKIMAHSVNKEANAEMVERHEDMIVQLRKAPELPYVFPEQLLFLWPKEGPSIKGALGQNLESLDIIRSKFGCHVFVLKDAPDFICVLGHDHDKIKYIAHRLRTKWAEVMANSNIRSKVYIVEPPETEHMKTKVVVHTSNSLHKALLSGGTLKESELEYWRSRAKLIQTKNNERIMSAVEKSLRGLVFVRGHLRMRVNLGSFILENYRAPKDDKASYGFEEFREMLLYDQTKGRLIPGLKVDQNELVARCHRATHLLEPYGASSSSLEDAELAYSVNFEFLPLSSNNKMLRLEAEFTRSPGAQEYETSQRRWLRPRKSDQCIEEQSPLQIAVIDFERSDWQLEVKSLEFKESTSIDLALKTFSHSIRFRRSTTMGDICAEPRRKVMFPQTAPVARFVEKTAMRYRLKGTKYILEIARYDEYSRINAQGYPEQNLASIGNEISEVPVTTWGASLFDPNWDNLLGGHANLSVGQSAAYNTDLDTFFPSQASPFEGKHTGFWELLSLVKQVAAVLGSRSVSPNSSSSSVGARSPPKPANAKKPRPVSQDPPPIIGVQGPIGLVQTDLGTLF